MMKKRIFIGSSSKTKACAERLGNILKKSCKVTFWWDDEVFQPGDIIFEDLQKTAHSVDAGLFILAEDDLIIENNTIKGVTRGNVLIETGLFFGIHGRKGVGLCVLGKPKIQSDLDGIVYFDMEMDDKILQVRFKNWLKQIPYNYINEENNVYMNARQKIHKLFPIKDRFGLDHESFKHINHVKLLNFACNLIVNPEDAEISHVRQDKNLSEVLFSLLKDTDATVQMILAKPTEAILKDIESKIANPEVGSAGSIYSAQYKIFKLLTEEPVYISAYKRPRRFSYMITDICIPFAIFNIEYDDDYSYLNHVKIDLYSAALSSENDRRSMIIWETNDKQNYDFFVRNFNDIRCKYSKTPDMTELKEYSERWIKMKK